MVESDGGSTDAGGERPGSETVPTAVKGRTRSAVLWGLVGALLFGVLYQGYVLVVGGWAWTVLVGGMVVVGATTTLLAHRFEARLGVDGI